MHIIAASACITNLMAYPLKLPVLMAICINLRLLLQKIKRQKLQITFNEKSGWELLSPNGIELVTVLKSTFISTYIIILRIKSQSSHILTIIVLNDALSEDNFRRFISQLKITRIEHMR
jgi:hypothetical protein